MNLLVNLEKKIEAKSKLFYFALSTLKHLQSKFSVFNRKKHKEDIAILKRECFLLCKELEKDINLYFKEVSKTKEPINFNIKLLERAILMNKKDLY